MSGILHIDRLPADWDPYTVARVLEVFARRIGQEIDASVVENPGEDNVLASLGVGTPIGAGKSGVELLLKSLVAGTNMTISADGTTITLDAAVPGGAGEANTASNLGTGQGVFASKVSVDLRFKTLVAGTGISLVASSTEITVTAAGIGTDDVTNDSDVPGTTASDALDNMRMLICHG